MAVTPSFQRRHAAMLCKYAGISFISGAVNHGFFSGERSAWTAAAGVVLFVAGAWMEHRLADSDDLATSLWRTLVLGTVLSIGLGFFTGGLQHFPDSPARSAWVVPLGFALSLAALLAQDGVRLGRGVAVYSLVGALAVVGGSWLAWQQLDGRPGLVADHSHADAGPALVAQQVTRSVDVRMDDSMRFAPANLQARAGETLRLVVRNDGRVEHELVLGTDEQIREHAKLMATGDAHQGHPGAAVSVPPGGTRELVVTFPKPGTLQVACLVPGHYEAGMRGTLAIAAAADAAPAAPASGHKH